MIPKKIHYCWFGNNPLPAVAKKCINSWKRYCPDYEIIEWNEKNFDISMNEYTKMCYREKKFAFLSDYARLIIIEREGGIYFDTDVEVIKSFDDLLECNAFFGFETEEYIASGLGFGSTANSDILRAMIRQYDQLLDGKHGTIGCPILNTIPIIEMGFIPNGLQQKIEDVVIYPIDFFNPLDNATGIIMKTDLLIH